jgi:hypothetical protein
MRVITTRLVEKHNSLPKINSARVLNPNGKTSTRFTKGNYQTSYRFRPVKTYYVYFKIMNWASSTDLTLG